jgi:hypothetical protein
VALSGANYLASELVGRVADRAGQIEGVRVNARDSSQAYVP